LGPLDEAWFVPSSDITITGKQLATDDTFCPRYEAMWNGVNIVVKDCFFLDDTNVQQQWTAEQQAEVIAKFLKECKTHSELQHPNIVHFHGVVVDEHRNPRKLMLESMPGGSLEELLYGPDSRALPLDRQLSIMVDICEALAYMHEQERPVLHLNLGPKCVLLNEQGRAKLGNLTESRMIRSLPTDKTVRTTSPFQDQQSLYGAPELSVKSATKGRRTDMFSAGVLICEIATGKRPNPTKESRKQGETLVKIPEQERRAADIALIVHDGIRDIVCNLIVEEQDARWYADQVLQRLKQLTSAVVEDTTA
jgi:serine/threonine protein kinase